MKSTGYLFIFILFLFLIATAGCQQKRIPESKMIDILAEVFITDAITSSGYNVNKLYKRDSIEYYKPILSKRGVTEEQLIFTLDYYTSKPAELDKLLDKVISQLSVKESKLTAQLKQETAEPEEAPVDESVDKLQRKNLWTRRRFWVFPRDGEQDSLYFKVKTLGAGTYTVTADVRVFPDDESIDPRLVMWFSSDKISSKGQKHNFNFERYSKDGTLKSIRLSSKLLDTTQTHFEGNLLNHTKRIGIWKKSAEVMNIKITFTPQQELGLNTKGLIQRDSLSSFKRDEKRISSDFEVR